MGYYSSNVSLSCFTVVLLFENLFTVLLLLVYCFVNRKYTDIDPAGQEKRTITYIIKL